MTLLDMLLQPFQFEFMRYALIISVLVAIPTALLSCFLVLKGWSLMGDAISHAVFPGVVIAYIVGIPYAIGAFAAGISRSRLTASRPESFHKAFYVCVLSWLSKGEPRFFRALR